MTNTSVEVPGITFQDVTSGAVQASAPIKASPAKALQEIVGRQLSGRLTIGDPNDNSIGWRVYVGNGQVHFATSAIGQFERLEYLWHRFYPDLELEQLAEGQSDYQVVCSYWKSGKLSLQQVRQLLFSLSQEALVQILALPQATIQFEKTLGIDPILLSVPLKQTISPARKHISDWVQLRPIIASPLQRAGIRDLEQFSQMLSLKAESPDSKKLSSDALMQNHCIYEVANRLKMDVLELATLLQPLVEARVVTINPYRIAQSDNRPVIACIDDSKTVQRNVKLTLESSGYRVLELMEPARALTALVRHKPALVLMDISMPDIDGYELCRMLRQSALLKETPIVMLTGRDGVIDRLRARMVGATDYMTKPFEPQQLLNTVYKFTSVSPVEVNS